MAAKFDKEMMKKQHFWLLLIPLFIGLLLAWLGLFFGVADATEEKLNANNKEKQNIESAKAQAKKTLELYDKRKEELFGLRTQRWREMWDLQQPIYGWPEDLGEEQIAKVKGMKFGDEISDPSFINYFRDQGMEGYKTLAKDVAPLQFAGDWRTALRTVPAWKRNPTSARLDGGPFRGRRSRVVSDRAPGRSSVVPLRPHGSVSVLPNRRRCVPTSPGAGHRVATRQCGAARAKQG